MHGKNGVTVNGALHTPSPSAVPLLSKDLITMGDSSFYFLLPAKKRSRCCCCCRLLCFASVLSASLYLLCSEHYCERDVREMRQA